MLKREGKKSLATEARHYVEIQRVTSTSDGEGGFTETWTTVKSCFAAIYPIKSMQRFEYKSIDVSATHYFKFRGYIDCQEQDRILFDSRYFEVLTIDNMQERDFELFVVCNEVRK